MKAQFPADGPLEYQSLTTLLPAAAWYERELHDMFGFEPQGHPDMRPLVLHESFPEGFHPLLKNIPRIMMHEDIVNTKCLPRRAKASLRFL